MANILDGRKLAASIKDQVKQTIVERNKQGKATPGLAVILVGENTASKSYVSQKHQACKQVGIHSTIHQLNADASQAELIDLITQLDHDRAVHGILLQLPLPHNIRATSMIEYINPRKDVDGFHPYNIGRLAQRHAATHRPLLRPCTPHGVMELIKTANIDLTGKHAVVVGASNIVGRPMVLELLLAKCTITICHRFTKNLKTHVENADVLVSATGRGDAINSEWIKPGAIVIDVGFMRLPDGSIRGDLDFATAAQRASWITPVPGGVGPMTVAMLLKNTLVCAELCELAEQKSISMHDVKFHE